MKPQALAPKVNSLALASKPQVLENCPVLGLRTALFFELLKFFEHLFFLISSENFIFWRTLAPVSLVLGLSSSIPVLVLKRVCPWKNCPWPRILFVSLAEASSLVSSTAPLIMAVVKIDYNCNRAVAGGPRGFSSQATTLM